MTEWNSPPVILRDWNWSINFLQLQRSHTHVQKCLAFDFSHRFDNNSRAKSATRLQNAFSFPQNLACFSSLTILHFFFSLVFLNGMLQLLSPLQIFKFLDKKEETFFFLRTFWCKAQWEKRDIFFGLWAAIGPKKYVKEWVLRRPRSQQGHEEQQQQQMSTAKS